jgi:hypothetical protein
MTEWTDDERRHIAQAMLGSWPSTVGAWRPEVLEAYIGQLEARGLTPDDAYTAILTWDGGDQIVPPTASQLAAVARRDPNRPTSDEMLEQVYGPGGVLGFKRSGVTISPWVTAFVQWYGLDRLHDLPVNGDHGQLIQNDLKQSYEQYVEANEHRKAADLAAGARRGELGRFDPRALPAARARLAVADEDVNEEAG